MTAIDDFEPLEFPWCSTPTPTSPRGRLRGITVAGNLLVLCFMLGLGTWASLAPLESAAIASGVVESESSRKTIQHLEGGIIRKILVSDGDIVRSGQTLIELDDTRAGSEMQSLQGQFWDAAARAARLQAEQQRFERIAIPDALEQDSRQSEVAAAAVSAQQFIFQARLQVHESQLAVIRERRRQVEKEIEGLKAQETATGQRVDIVREELDMVATLVNKGLERRPRLLNLQRELADVEGRRGEIAAQIARAGQVISEQQATLFKLESERQNEIAQSLREAQNQIFQLRERLLAARDQLSRTEIKAPEDGVITDLRVHTAGGVIGAGAPLMDLVPRQDRLIVTARLRPEGHRCGSSRPQCRGSTRTVQSASRASPEGNRRARIRRPAARQAYRPAILRDQDPDRRRTDRRERHPDRPRHAGSGVHHDGARHRGSLRAQAPARQLPWCIQRGLKRDEIGVNRHRAFRVRIMH
ncbi:HlyD family secretion protein [Bradyrhizobium sp. i1.7.7]